MFFLSYSFAPVSHLTNERSPSYHQSLSSSLSIVSHFFHLEDSVHLTGLTAGMFSLSLSSDLLPPLSLWLIIPLVMSFFFLFLFLSFVVVLQFLLFSVDFSWMLLNPVCFVKPGQLIHLQVGVSFERLCFCAVFAVIIMTGESRHDSRSWFTFHVKSFFQMQPVYFSFIFGCSHVSFFSSFCPFFSPLKEGPCFCSQSHHFS